MDRALKTLVVLWTYCALAACSPAASPSTLISTAPPTELPAITSTPAGSRTEMPPLPACTGMQKLNDPVEFDWPNLKASMEQFIASAWEYYSCEQPPAEVARLYREALPNAPYNLSEMNWLQRDQGTLGIYFSQAGLWYYVWFLPQPGDARRSYLVLTESMASVEC